jgi:hypothetical protein
MTARVHVIKEQNIVYLREVFRRPPQALCRRALRALDLKNRKIASGLTPVLVSSAIVVKYESQKPFSRRIHRCPAIHSVSRMTFVNP